jgi:hypothetical protein
MEFVKDGQKSRRLSPMDVIMGRGININRFHGNENFRRLVDEHRARYLRSSRPVKRTVAIEVVKIIQSEGGNFVRRLHDTKSPEEGDLCEIIPHGRAIEKACQALREMKVLGYALSRSRKSVKKKKKIDTSESSNNKKAKDSSRKPPFAGNKKSHGTGVERVNEDRSTSSETDHGTGVERVNEDRSTSSETDEAQSPSPVLRRPRNLPNRAGLKKIGPKVRKAAAVRLKGGPRGKVIVYKIIVDEKASSPSSPSALDNENQEEGESLKLEALIKRPARPPVPRELGAIANRRPLPVSKRKLQAVIRRPALALPQKVQVSIIVPAEEDHRQQLTATPSSEAGRVAISDDLRPSHGDTGTGSSLSPTQETTREGRLSGGLTSNRRASVETAASSLVLLYKSTGTPTRDLLADPVLMTPQTSDEKRSCQEQDGTLVSRPTGMGTPEPYMMVDRGGQKRQEQLERPLPLPPPLVRVKMPQAFIYDRHGQQGLQTQSFQVTPVGLPRLINSSLMRSEESSAAEHGFEKPCDRPLATVARSSHPPPHFGPSLKTSGPNPTRPRRMKIIFQGSIYQGESSHVNTPGPTSLVGRTSIESPKASVAVRRCNKHQERSLITPIGLPRETLVGRSTKTPQVMPARTFPSQLQESTIGTPAGPPSAPTLWAGPSMMTTPQASYAARQSQQQERSLVTPAGPSPTPALAGPSKTTPQVSSARRLSQHQERSLVSPATLPHAPSLFRPSMKTPQLPSASLRSHLVQEGLTLVTPVGPPPPPAVYRRFKAPPGSAANSSSGSTTTTTTTSQPQIRPLLLAPAAGPPTPSAPGGPNDNDSEDHSMDVSCISCFARGESGCTCRHRDVDLMMMLPCWVGRDVVVHSTVNTSPMKVGAGGAGGTGWSPRVVPPRRVSDVADHYRETGAPLRWTTTTTRGLPPTNMARVDDPWDNFVSGRLDLN